jgi:hypothetical protein
MADTEAAAETEPQASEAEPVPDPEPAEEEIPEHGAAEESEKDSK